MRSSKCYNIWHTWTVSFHLWNGRTEMLKKKKNIFIFSLFFYDFFSSLSCFFLLSLSGISVSSLSSVTPSFLFLLQKFHLSLFLFFFPLLSLRLSLSPPRSLPLRSAVAMEFGLTDEVDWWRSYVSLASFFFFFGCGFRVIVGGGGVGLIPCDLGCINGVDSSLHFFFFLEFCVDFADFIYLFIK